jgi:hypothetical protein
MNEELLIIVSIGIIATIVKLFSKKNDDERTDTMGYIDPENVNTLPAEVVKRDIKFKNIKYVGGLLEIQEKTLKVNLLATEHGIELFKAASNQKICTLPWAEVVKIEASTGTDSGQQAMRTGFAAKSNSNIGAGIGIGISQALFDTHSLIIYIRKSPNDEFIQEIRFDDMRHEEIKTYLIQCRLMFYTNVTNKSTLNVANDGDDPVTKIEKLADLKNKGIITEVEFDKKKQELLNRI